MKRRGRGEEKRRGREEWKEEEGGKSVREKEVEGRSEGGKQRSRD